MKITYQKLIPNIFSGAIRAALLLGTLTATAALAQEPPTATTNAPAAATKTLPTVSVKDYLKSPATWAGKRIVLQGFVTDVCRKKGCWALLHDADSEAKGQVRVKQNEEGDTFKPFLPELQGQTIQVTGEVQETKIDAAYLDKWETNVKAAKERTLKATGEKDNGDSTYDTTLKQIAEYRERAAKSERGYLSSYSVTVEHWQAERGQ